MNITEHFIKATELSPNNVAIIEKDKTITYSELLEEMNKTAAYFAKKGIKKGDRVLVFVPMSIDLYRIVLALFYMGATAVFLDEWVSKKRLELCCELANCKGFIGNRKAQVLSIFSKKLRKIPVKLSISGRKSEKMPLSTISENDSALITFTTGSTGKPKAANRTHHFLNEQFKALIHEIEPSPKDVDMTLLPIVLFLNLGIGCTSVIGKVKMKKIATENLEPIISQISKNSVTRITGSPSFFNRMSEYTRVSGLQLSNIEKIFTGGGPVFPDEAENYQQIFPNAQVKIVYGSTEAEPISSISAKELISYKNKLKKGLAVGDIYSGTHLKIIPFVNSAMPELTKAHLESKSIEDGKLGEIIVSGNHVLKNYYNNPEAYERNKIVTEDSIWHRTGDCGFIENGTLFLAGRCEQMIEKEGVSFSPFVIEHQLSQIPEIELGTVLLVNNHIIAVIESSFNKQIVEEKLAHFNFDKVLIVKKIPRDPRHNTKIDYEKLKVLN